MTYQKAIFETILFNVEDVITTSGGDQGSPNLDGSDQLGLTSLIKP